MPKRTDLKSILIIGAGPIVIGQACEFDYSGTQACKALKEEGYRVVLVNSNPATIMTDPEFADVTYIEPLTLEFLEKIIAAERPSALLPTLGGQTALNLSMELHKKGILEKYGVEMIGAKPDAISKGEDRELFKQAMIKIGLDVARSRTVKTMDEARAAAEMLGNFPLIIRPSFTLGGSGGGIAYNREEFERICANGLDLSPVHEVLVEECLLGWKEYEMEVMRDHKDQCVVICSIENFDPMGVHTGDSITVAPFDDADGQGVSGHARRFVRGHSRNRRRDRRVQHPVFRRSANGSHGRDRDESPGVALVRARLQGHRVPDREDRGETRRGLLARRAAQRHHPPDAGLV
jgi:carbamoyl-phosphate synthase large subunit